MAGTWLLCTLHNKASVPNGKAFHAAGGVFLIYSGQCPVTKSFSPKYVNTALAKGAKEAVSYLMDHAGPSYEHFDISQGTRPLFCSPHFITVICNVICPCLYCIAYGHHSSNLPLSEA